MIMRKLVYIRNYKYCKEVGERVRFARKKAGFTQDALARVIDMKPTALCYIENGRVATHITTLKEIADALNVSVKEFV